MRAAGGVVLLMAIVPGLPKIPFVLMGATLLFVSSRLPDEQQLAFENLPALPAGANAVEAPPPQSPQQLAVDARVEPLELNIAFDLIPLVDNSSGGDLLDRVGALRRKIASELGFVMPSIRTRDAADLPAGTYVIKVHGVEVGRGIAPTGRVLVIGDSFDTLPGDDVKEPVFGLAARWARTARNPMTPTRSPAAIPAAFTRRRLLALGTACASWPAWLHAQDFPEAALRAAVDGPGRSPANRLRDGARHAPEYEGGLSNHLPMALVALHRLGADVKQLSAWNESYARRLQPAPALDTWPPGDPWPDRLGQADTWPLYRSLFQQWVDYEGARETLAQTLPVLMPGCGAAAFHGPIRVAYAARSGHQVCWSRALSGRV